MELQQRSSKRSKHSSRRKVRASIGWTPLQIVQVVGCGLVAASPWYYGGAPWIAQYWMVWVTLILAVLMGLEFLRRFWASHETRTIAIPSLSSMMLGIAAVGWLQTVPAFSVEGQGGWAPASVQIQRWFLGVPNSKLDVRFGTAASAPIPVGAGEPLAAYPDARLAVSVEPLHTRAAIGGLSMIAVMIWLGAAAFTTERGRLTLLIFITLMGVGIGLVGLAHVLSWEQVNWLGLDAKGSFATFVSRNCAGAFLNVCLAASIGLAAWAFAQPSQKEPRYAYAHESPGVRALRVIEDVFAKLTTVQIASLFSTTFILTCVLCTGSRGASISAVVACLVAFMLGRAKKRNTGNWIFASFVVLIGLTAIFFFEFDQRLTKRFSELASAETLENDLQAGRTYIWLVALKAFAFFGLLGSGVGTFHFAHLPFQNPFVSGWYYHAESLYAQALVELGWLGIIAIVAILAVSIRCIRALDAAPPKVFSRLRDTSASYTPFYLVGVTLVISQAIHSFVDFALIVPAVFLPASLLIGMVCGLANQKRYNESKPNPVPAVNPIASQRLPKIEGSRFANMVEEPMASSLSKKRRWTRQHSLLLSGCLVAVMFLVSSLSPLGAMSRVDSMNRWLKESEKGNFSARIGSPMAYLAGIWGNSNVPISRSPDALRILGESVLYEFRSARLNEDETSKDLKPFVAWEKTSPLLVRLEMNEKETEWGTDSNASGPFEKTPAFLSLMGGEKQFARWDKSRELIERAHLQSPLDWRLVWGRLLLDRRLNVREWNGWYDRCAMLSQHRAETLFQIGVLARQGAKDRSNVDTVWAKVMQMSPDFVPRVAALIAMDSTDEEVNTDVFPPIPYYLHGIASNPFDKARFPATNDRLWVRIEESALEMDPNNSLRYFWLASAASNFGKTEEELVNLEEAVRRNSLNRQLRLQWAERLAATGDIKTAIEQAEFCNSLAPDDAQIESTLKRLRAMESDSPEAEP